MTRLTPALLLFAASFSLASCASTPAQVSAPESSPVLAAEARAEGAAPAETAETTQAQEEAQAPQGRRIPKLTIPVPQNARVERFRKQYESEEGLNYLSAVMTRSAPYRAFILAEADRLGAPDFLLYLPVIESSFSERAVSRSGATGIWQFMRNSVGGYGIRIDEWLDERRDPWLSSTAALRKLMENYNQLGDWCLALAAYNCGLGAVSRAVRQAGASDYWELCERGYFKSETVNYVPKFLAIAEILSRSEELGIDWGEEMPVSAFETIAVSKAVDINLLAKKSGEDPAFFARLNPALHYSITPSGVEYALRIPAEKKEAVLEVLNSGEPLIQYYVYKIRSGDTLYALSLHYGVSVDMIAECNPGIRAEALRIGSNIIIPALREVEAYRGRTESSQRQFTGTYRVKEGDTLWSIALAYDVQIETLAERNGIDLNAPLSLGKVLKVPAL